MKRCPELCICLFLAVSGGSVALPAQTITFASPRKITVAPANFQVAIAAAGDFNGDGKTDFLVRVLDPTNDSDQSKVLVGDGAGNFSIVNAPNIPALGPSLVRNEVTLVTDVNGDGKDDIITLIGGCQGQDSTPCSNGALSVFLSDGGGHFAADYTHALPLGFTYGVVGDFNKDGRPDVAVIVDPGEETPGSAKLMVFLNEGNGSFQETTYGLPSEFPGHPLSNLVTGDFSGNGNLDLGVVFSIGLAQTIQADLFTFAGNGQGGFAAAQLRYMFDSVFPGSGSQGTPLQATDLNGDGRTDLIISLTQKDGMTTNPRIATLLATSSGAFHWASAVSVATEQSGIGPQSILLSDLNGDGKLDLVTLENEIEILPPRNVGSVYAGLGDGEFQTPHIPLNFDIAPVTSDPHLLAAPLQKGDLPSLILSTGAPMLELLVNTTK